MTKFEPIKEKEYMVTDECFWKKLSKEEMETYNPYDKNRLPHGVGLIDVETGTMVNLLSGSIIKIVKSRES